jgi:poly(A) polymerase
MSQPRVVPRSEHSISRSLIDPEALKVLYRLHQSHYTAYLVGGSVRDLLLGRKPKDFDIGTSAHPYEVKKLFRNCWIIGRRFRLAHVRFGAKTVEVATFRRLVTAEELATAADEAAAALAQEAAETAPLIEESIETPEAPAVDVRASSHGAEHSAARDRLVHRDNTFGTPEEDAFRRDFTINALFYDIATFSLIDYTGGLDDLRAGLIRSIGDPLERFQEDPVRMLRAVAFASRLGFTLDAPVEQAIAARRADLIRCAPARLMEEIYKLLRSGAAERAFRMLAERRLLEPISRELQLHAGEGLWSSLAALDAYRNRFESVPEAMTNPILLGSLLVPLAPTARLLTAPRYEDDSRKEPAPALGMLPLPRRDVERLRQIIGMQRRMTDLTLSPRTRRALTHRGSFREALAWLEIHGQAPEALEHWRGFLEAAETGVPDGEEPVEPAAAPPRRRRRRRGRRRTPSTSAS